MSTILCVGTICWDGSAFPCRRDERALSMTPSNSRHAEYDKIACTSLAIQNSMLLDVVRLERSRRSIVVWYWGSASNSDAMRCSPLCMLRVFYTMRHIQESDRVG